MKLSIILHILFCNTNNLPSPVLGNCTIKHLLTVGGSIKVPTTELECKILKLSL